MRALGSPEGGFDNVATSVCGPHQTCFRRLLTCVTVDTESEFEEIFFARGRR